MTDTPAVQYQPGTHKGQAVIWLRFAYHAALTAQVKQLPGCRWSQSHKSWYVPDTAAYRGQFGMVAQSLAVAQLDSNGNPKPTSAPNHREPANTARHYKVNGHVLPAMRQQLVLKAYSPSTITTYTNEMGAFLATIKNTAADGFTPQRLKDYTEMKYITTQFSQAQLCLTYFQSA